MVDVRVQPAFHEVGVEEAFLGAEYGGGGDTLLLQQVGHCTRVVLGRPFAEQVVQLAAAPLATVLAAEPVIGGPIGTAHGRNQTLPLRLRCHRNGHPLVIAGAGVVAVRSHRGVVVAARLQGASGQGVFHQAEALRDHGGPQHRNVDELPLAGAVAVVQRGRDGEHRVERPADVSEGVFESQRPTILVSHRAVEAGQGPDGRSVGAQVAQRAVLSGGGNGCHDDVGLDGAERFIAEAQTIHHTGREVLDDNIAAGRQSFGEFDSLRFADVEGNAQLAAVDVVEHRVLFGVGLVADDGSAQSHIVQTLAGFNLDDLGAHVGQNHAGDGAGQHPAEIQHTVAGQDAAVFRPVYRAHDAPRPLDFWLGR